VGARTDGLRAVLGPADGQRLDRAVRLRRARIAVEAVGHRGVETADTAPPGLPGVEDLLVPRRVEEVEVAGVGETPGAVVAVAGIGASGHHAGEGVVQRRQILVTVRATGQRA